MFKPLYYAKIDFRAALQDGGIGHHRGEKSAALLIDKAVPVMTPTKGIF